MRQIWIQIPALYLIGCVTLGKSLAVSDLQGNLQFPQCQMQEVVLASSSLSSHVTMYLRTQNLTIWIREGWLDFRTGIGGK